MMVLGVILISIWLFSILLYGFFVDSYFVTNDQTIETKGRESNVIEIKI